MPILIDSDAHGVRELQLVRWGVATARRAWLTAEEGVRPFGLHQGERLIAYGELWVAAQPVRYVWLTLP